MRILAFVCAHLVGLTVLGLGAETFFHLATEVRTGPELLLLTTCYSAACVGTGLMAYGLSLAALAVIFNGRQAVGYAFPSACTSFSTWFLHSWRFHSNGRQEGFRFLGVEVAVSGPRL